MKPAYGSERNTDTTSARHDAMRAAPAFGAKTGALAAIGG
jgi:hypothetical protein